MQQKNYINTKTKIAIIGGTSFIGNKLLFLLKKKFQITATYNNRKKYNKEYQNYMEKIRLK